MARFYINYGINTAVTKAYEAERYIVGDPFVSFIRGAEGNEEVVAQVKTSEVITITHEDAVEIKK